MGSFSSPMALRSLETAVADDPSTTITDGQTDSISSCLVTISPECRRSWRRISRGLDSRSTRWPLRAIHGGARRIRNRRTARGVQRPPLPQRHTPCCSRSYHLFRILKNCVRTSKGERQQANVPLGLRWFCKLCHKLTGDVTNIGNISALVLSRKVGAPTRKHISWREYGKEG